MFQPLEAKSQQQLSNFCSPPQLPPLDPQIVARHRADAHWLLRHSAGHAAARCSLWWVNTPPYPGQQVGLIGHYAARTGPAAARLLALACEQLQQQGCTVAIGPMDGSTWRSYRLATTPGSEPPFFLEPTNPADWPAHFTDAGFEPLATYFSTITANLRPAVPRLARVARRAGRHGLTIRPFNPARFDEELRHLYTLSRAAFSGNFLYTPLAEAEFVAMYRPLRPLIQPNLILLVEKEGQPAGFIFALPDLLQRQRGQPIDTVIIKTVAVHPNFQTYGLGTLLVDRCQQAAHALGYRRAIHALMHQTNESRKISRRLNSHPMREYALFAKKL